MGTTWTTASAVPFGSVVRAAYARGELVVQPRMGYSDPAKMLRGLRATKHAAAVTAGSLTLDSFTRTGQLKQAGEALASGLPLNGYPIASYPPSVTRELVAEVRDAGFPVQVRHGSPRPRHIFEALLAAGLDATEGGPVSYCLPYGRVPLRASVRSWRRCCELLSQRSAQDARPHLETFGGCLMGQLCPPSLLVAVSILEALFFQQHGVLDVSVSYAQQTHPEQDQDAVLALRRLAHELLAPDSWHIVVYAYMGVYPRTAAGARRLNRQAARLAVTAGAARLIVKTAAEAFRIPSIEENVAALESAAEQARASTRSPAVSEPPESQTYVEARALVESVLELATDIGKALVLAFERGLLDVPYCLHPDNAGRAKGFIDEAGYLRWYEVGALPIGGVAETAGRHTVTSAELLDSLTYLQRRYDQEVSEC